ADWQEYFRKQQPPMLITWGKNDGIVTVEGAELYKRDIPSAELHLLDTGHFALEEEVDRIGSLMHDFFDRKINKKKVLKGRCEEISFDFGSSPSDMQWKDPVSTRGVRKMNHTIHDIGVARQIGAYSDAIEVGHNLRWLLTSG